MAKGRFALKPAQRPGRPPSPVEDNNWKLAPTAMPNMAGLDHIAAEEAGRLTRYLVALDRVAAIDRQSLAVYCTQWSLFCRLMRDEFAPENRLLSGDGPTCEVAHPLIAPLLRSSKSIIRLAGLFGMTARTRDLESTNGNRKASALKKLMGNQRKVAEGRLEQGVILPMLPDFGRGDLVAPLWMNQRARHEFERLGEELEKLDLFTPLDLAPLVVVSCLFDLYLRAGDQLRDLTTVVMNSKGEDAGYKEHPLLKAQFEIAEIMHAIWKDYGQTPRYRKVFNGERKVEKKEIPLVFKGAFG